MPSARTVRRALPPVGRLRRERRGLLRSREERLRDLGGLVLEMFRRDQFRRGLPQAGVLISSTFPSLHPGYYVVFSGIYSSPAEAAGALADAHSHGFPDAYVARVTHG